MTSDIITGVLKIDLTAMIHKLMVSWYYFAVRFYMHQAASVFIHIDLISEKNFVFRNISTGF